MDEAQIIMLNGRSQTKKEYMLYVHLYKTLENTN